MPAVTVDNPLVLPRIAGLPAGTPRRRVDTVVAARRTVEGGGFVVHRPFPGRLSQHDTDPFLLLDQLGPVTYAPGEATGAPWHPHRGFETVTYVIDGVVQHTDSHGGGGVIGDGDTQWMTAGSGLLHDEVPTEVFRRHGGVTHGVQLWVNLPAALKLTPPRYQPIEAGALTLLTSPDGGALVRLIAGELDGHRGPGSTHTPITYAHATLAAGARLVAPWPAGFNAMVYVLSGAGSIGAEQRPVDTHDLAVLGPDGAVQVDASEVGPIDVLLLGGLPIREPIAHYGPFVMNTRAELVTAIEDYQAGRMGTIPAGG